MATGVYHKSDYPLITDTMTDKQLRIVEVALDLFASQGYASTPTSQIAQEAEVSEGLIFRHFANKEGLLEAIITTGLSRVQNLASSILAEEEPQVVLSRIIELPVQLIRSHPQFWRLQASLKYQRADMAQKYDESDLFLQLKAATERAFRRLNYPNPRAETRLLLIILNGLMNELAGEDHLDQDALVNFIKDKYRLR